MAGKREKKLTIKQENFCQEYIKNGGVAADAYRKAYNAEGSSNDTLAKRGYELIHNSQITGRINEIKSQISERNNISNDELVQMALDIYKKASSIDVPQFSAAMRSLDFVAKLLGRYTLKVDQEIIVKRNFSDFYNENDDDEEED